MDDLFLGLCARRSESGSQLNKYVTLDSGARQGYESGMVRDFQEGKPMFGLVMPLDMPYHEQYLTRIAALMSRGAEKYGKRNWEKANSTEELERFKDSAFRHFMQWFFGETDEDHAAAVFFNVQAAEYLTWKLGEPCDPMAGNEGEKTTNG